MKEPVSVAVDRTAGYVSYAADRKIASTVDILSDGVAAADLDASGNVVGIEVLDFDAATLEAARAYAETRGLAFPNDLAGAGSK